MALYAHTHTKLRVNVIRLLLLVVVESCGHVLYALKWPAVGAENFECFDVIETVFKVTCFVDS